MLLNRWKKQFLNALQKNNEEQLSELLNENSNKKLDTFGMYMEGKQSFDWLTALLSQKEDAVKWLIQWVNQTDDNHRQRQLHAYLKENISVFNQLLGPLHQCAPSMVQSVLNENLRQYQLDCNELLYLLIASQKQGCQSVGLGVLKRVMQRSENQEESNELKAMQLQDLFTQYDQWAKKYQKSNLGTFLALGLIDQYGQSIPNEMMQIFKDVYQKRQMHAQGFFLNAPQEQAIDFKSVFHLLKSRQDKQQLALALIEFAKQTAEVLHSNDLSSMGQLSVNLDDTALLHWLQNNAQNIKTCEVLNNDYDETTGGPVRFGQITRLHQALSKSMEHIRSIKAFKALVSERLENKALSEALGEYENQLMDRLYQWVKKNPNIEKQTTEKMLSEWLYAMHQWQGQKITSLPLSDYFLDNCGLMQSGNTACQSWVIPEYADKDKKQWFENFLAINQPLIRNIEGLYQDVVIDGQIDWSRWKALASQGVRLGHVENKFGQSILTKALRGSVGDLKQLLNYVQQYQDPLMADFIKKFVNGSGALNELILLLTNPDLTVSQLDEKLQLLQPLIGVKKTLIDHLNDQFAEPMIEQRTGGIGLVKKSGLNAKAKRQFKNLLNHNKLAWLIDVDKAQDPQWSMQVLFAYKTQAQINQQMDELMQLGSKSAHQLIERIALKAMNEWTKGSLIHEKAQGLSITKGILQWMLKHESSLGFAPSVKSALIDANALHGFTGFKEEKAQQVALIKHQWDQKQSAEALGLKNLNDLRAYYNQLPARMHLMDAWDKFFADNRSTAVQDVHKENLVSLSGLILAFNEKSLDITEVYKKIQKNISKLNTDEKEQSETIKKVINDFETFANAASVEGSLDYLEIGVIKKILATYLVLQENDGYGWVKHIKEMEKPEINHQWMQAVHNHGWQPLAGMHKLKTLKEQNQWELMMDILMTQENASSWMNVEEYNATSLKILKSKTIEAAKKIKWVQTNLTQNVLKIRNNLKNSNSWQQIAEDLMQVNQMIETLTKQQLPLDDEQWNQLFLMSLYLKEKSEQKQGLNARLFSINNEQLAYEAQSLVEKLKNDEAFVRQLTKKLMDGRLMNGLDASIAGKEPDKLNWMHKLTEHCVQVIYEHGQPVDCSLLDAWIDKYADLNKSWDSRPLAWMLTQWRFEHAKMEVPEVLYAKWMQWIKQSKPALDSVDFKASLQLIMCAPKKWIPEFLASLQASYSLEQLHQIKGIGWINDYKKQTRVAFDQSQLAQKVYTCQADKVTYDLLCNQTFPWLNYVYGLCLEQTNYTRLQLLYGNKNKDKENKIKEYFIQTCNQLKIEYINDLRISEVFDNMVQLSLIDSLAKKSKLSDWPAPREFFDLHQIQEQLTNPDCININTSVKQKIYTWDALKKHMDILSTGPEHEHYEKVQGYLLGGLKALNVQNALTGRLLETKAGSVDQLFGQVLPSVALNVFAGQESGNWIDMHQCVPSEENKQRLDELFANMLKQSKDQAAASYQLAKAWISGEPVYLHKDQWLLATSQSESLLIQMLSHKVLLMGHQGLLVRTGEQIINCSKLPDECLRLLDLDKKVILNQGAKQLTSIVQNLQLRALINSNETNPNKQQTMKNFAL